jgi:PKD repeat protein
MFADAEIPLPVENQPPVAEAGPDQGAHPGAKVSFDGSGSYDVDGTIVSYEWDLGDGSSASGALVEHAYASQGNYSVSLTVTDDDGATGTDSAAVSVYNIPPVAEAGSDAAGTIFTNFTFDGTGSYDMDGTIVSYCWDFGDGATGTGPVTGHAYSAKGMYTVTLTVQDDDGAMDSDTAIVYVGNFPPVAVSSYTTGFNALNGENVTLTLRVAGTKYFQVSLAITENGNITDSVSITRHPGSPNVQEKSCNVTMNSTKAYMAVISWSSDRNGDSPVWLFLNNGVIDIRLKYNFNAQHDGPTATRTEDLNSLLGSAVNSSRYVKFDGSRSYDPDGFIVSYAWDFGDGKSGYGAIAAHSYAAAGIFSASLTVVDNDGSNSVTYFTVNVSDTFKNPDDGDSLGSGSDISMNVHSIWAAGGGEAAAAILLAVFLAIGAVSGIVSYAKRTPKNRKNRNSAIFGGI